MSYDLSFRRDNPIDLAEVRAYFERRGFQVTAESAVFENEATGAHFRFDFFPADEADAPISFNLNYYRPSWFALEAEPALTDFVKTFALDIDDPQQDGMGQGRYSPEGFMRGWNAGNALACRVAASPDVRAAQPLTLPAVRNVAAWRWNYAKDAMLEELTARQDELPPCFIPTAMLLVPKGTREVKTAVVWDAKMAIAIPDVELVASVNDRGALIAAPRERVIGALDVHSRWHADRRVRGDRPIGLDVDLIDGLDAKTTARVKTLMKALTVERASPAQVLDEELVAAAASR